MNIANYADDITPFIMKNKTNVIVSSEQVLTLSLIGSKIIV